MIEEKLFGVPYKTITVNSMGNKNRHIIYTCLSFIAMVMGIMVEVCFFTTDFSKNDTMTISDHIITGLLFSVIFFLILVAVIYNFIVTIRIAKDHKDFDLYLINCNYMYKIGEIPSDMYTCFVSESGIVIGWIADKKYINDFLSLGDWYFYQFVDIYEKQHKETQTEIKGDNGDVYEK